MPAPDLSVPSLPVVAWPDAVIDALGFDPRSTYVERFWLTVLGPSTTWLVRHMARRLDEEPGGFTLELDATAAALGLGQGLGRHSPLVRALHRSCQFGAARATAEGHLAVRRHLPPLTRHQIARLPAPIRAQHDEWRAVERDAATLDAQHRRARRIALALAELGEDVPTTEQRLQRWHIHAVVAHEAAAWAARLMAARAADGTLDGTVAGPALAPVEPPLLGPTVPVEEILVPRLLGRAADERPDLGGDAA